MSADIKPGDLVMVVRPSRCCGRSDAIGMVGTVEPNPTWARYAQCDGCGAADFNHANYRTIDGGGYHVDTLKKIEPPAIDDEAPAHRELEVVA